jgi:O-antigen/teichoic acid export membrane protein
LTSGSIRIGISLTAPIISLLLVSSKFVLSLIGTEYVSGEILLMILSVAILPFAIATNTISRLNILGKWRELLFIGSLQIIGFIVSFILLVPHLQGVGAALSILISYSVSCIPTLFWSERILLRYIANTVIAVAAGLGASSIFKILLPEGNANDFATMLTSVLVTLIVIFALKNTSISEVRILLKTVVKGANTT